MSSAAYASLPLADINLYFLIVKTYNLKFQWALSPHSEFKKIKEKHDKPVVQQYGSVCKRKCDFDHHLKIRLGFGELQGRVDLIQVMCIFYFDENNTFSRIKHC